MVVEGSASIKRIEVMKRLIPEIIGSLLVSGCLTGCITGLGEDERLDFVIEINGDATPDVDQCEVFRWERPSFVGGVADDDYELWVAPCEFGYRTLSSVAKKAGVVTYFEDDNPPCEIRKEDLTVETYAEVVSNIVLSLNLDSKPRWVLLTGLSLSDAEEEFESAVDAYVRSCVFPALRTIAVVPRYCFRYRFVFGCHTIVPSGGKICTEADLRFYSFDRSLFATLWHTTPYNFFGLVRARKELVEYLFDTIKDGVDGCFRISGHVLRSPMNCQELEIIVDKRERINPNDYALGG